MKGDSKIFARKSQEHCLRLFFFGTAKNEQKKPKSKILENTHMAFFNSAVGVLQTLVVALGAGLGIWGAINLMEGYGNDNPGANAHVR